MVRFASAGVRLEGEPVAGAPYSAEAVTKIVQTLADGNRIRHENRVKIYRDSQGRTRREETLESVGPWSSAEPHRMIFINDPVAGDNYVIDPQRQTVHKMEIRIAGGAGAQSAGEAMVRRDVTVIRQQGQTEEFNVEIKAAPPAAITAVAAARPAAGWETEQEDLGQQFIEGVLATGQRFTTVIPPEAIGNEREIRIVDERWRSSELGVEVRTSHSDPRFGETEYTLQNVQRVEPDPSLFVPPADYQVEGPGDVMFFRRAEPAQ